MPATKEATAELFDEIDPTYFREGSFDATQYELDVDKSLFPLYCHQTTPIIEDARHRV